MLQLPSLLVALVACAPFLAPATVHDPARANTQAPPATEAAPPVTLTVVQHRGDVALRDRLVRTTQVWFDAGDFLVLHGRPALLSGLASHGVRFEALPPVRADEELYVVGVSEDATVAKIRAANGRLLFRQGEQALVAVPAGGGEPLHDLEPGRFFHCGLTQVAPRALAPTRALGPPPGAVFVTGPKAARIQTLVDAVNAQNIEDVVIDLSSLHSRRADHPGSIVARDLLRAELDALGFTTSLQSFNPLYSENVVAELPGVLTPNEFVVIGAHYDSVNWADGASATAPGADDNASGSGGVLEAARVLALDGPYERTLRFVLFSGEELGLLGSQFSSEQSLLAGEHIAAMLNMDMIAYRAPGDARDVDLPTNNTTPWLVALCDQLGATYVPNWASHQGVLTAGSSDHASFFADGWPAAFFFEDISQYFTQIHTANDAYPTSTTDFLLARMIVQGVVATAATLAEFASIVIAHTPLTDTPVTGPYAVTADVTSISGSNITAVELHWRVEGGAWSLVPMQHLGGASYAATIPAVASPLIVEYYLVAYDDQADEQTLPRGANAGEPPYSFLVGTRTVVFFDDFEAPLSLGWTHGATAGQSDWQRGAPKGKAGDPNVAYSGSRVWANDLGVGSWDGFYEPNTTNWLRSPVLDLSAAPTVLLEFQRWLTVEDSQYDQAEVRVNGQVVWRNGTGGAGNPALHTMDTEWTFQQLDVTAHAAGQAAVQFEFVLSSDDGLQFGGWNLDDFAVVSLEPAVCPAPSSYCTTTPNSAGAGAVISSNGMTSIAANAFELTVTGAAPGQNGAFFFGMSMLQAPFGDGLRCVGGNLQRLPVLLADGAGNAAHSLDLTGLPPGGSILPGTTRHFQYWYRDPAASGAGFNLSDALTVPFCD